jgi:hypothetical protein
LQGRRQPHQRGLPLGQPGALLGAAVLDQANARFGPGDTRFGGLYALRHRFGLRAGARSLAGRLRGLALRPAERRVASSASRLARIIAAASDTARGSAAARPAPSRPRRQAVRIGGGRTLPYPSR